MVAIDQAEEISLDDMGLLQGTLRLKIGETPLPTKVLLTANPEICWLKDTFIDYPEEGDIFVPALPRDNEFLPDDYIDRLVKGWEHRPERIKQYVEGNWDILASDNVVIKPMWVKNCLERPLKINYHRRLVSCDPARYGDDETVIYVFEDAKVIDQMILGDVDTMTVAGYCMALKNRYKAELIVIDITGGLGAGVADRINELTSETNDTTAVLFLNYSEKATNGIKQEKFINKRAEMYWESAEYFERGDVDLHNDPLLISLFVS